MTDDNAINPETGETIYVGILERLPSGFIWIHNVRSSGDWLKIIRNAVKNSTICSKCNGWLRGGECENCQ